MFGADDEDWQIYRKLVRRSLSPRRSIQFDVVLPATEHCGCILR
jgi:cytochrome P450